MLSMAELIDENERLKRLLREKENEVLEHIDRAYNKHQEMLRLKAHDRTLSESLTAALRKLADIESGVGVADLNGQETFHLQYGVQIVWLDPVKAGAVLPGEGPESYVPKWQAFDEKEAADRFERRMRLSMGEDIKSTHRATRWALEVYTDWEITP